MPYLVDTDVLIDRLAGEQQATQLLDRLADDGIAISIVTYMEVYQGVLRTPDREAAERPLDDGLSSIPVLPLSRSVARRCAGLRETLKSERKRVNQRALDLIIAATAIEYQLTLVTRNLNDYADIAGLVLYTS
jgi:tRNA(fMet)-specific endonuclease VapC